jgi:Mlc titration factor MtfA (ptsG expression regulator)
MAGLWGSLFKRPAALPEVSAQDWANTLARPVFSRLGSSERIELRALAEALLADKTFSPAGDARPGGEDLAAIAAFAALPVLRLGLSWYEGWQEVVLYPAEFVHVGEEVDEAGVVHPVRHVRAGEAWAGGPLVLSLDDVAASGWNEGYNVVIHEFAHKLDMTNGAVDGLPALHGGLSAKAWAAAFEPAYGDFCRRTEAGEEGDIDPYAAENPGEFFAVLTEYFFEWPQALVAIYPAVYDQLCSFFRQHPLETHR